MGYSLQRPRAPLDELAKLPTNARSFNGLLTSTPTRTGALEGTVNNEYTGFNGLLTSTPTRTGLCLSPTSTDKRLLVSIGYSLQRPRAQLRIGGNSYHVGGLKFQWATHLNAHRSAERRVGKER